MLKRMVKYKYSIRSVWRNGNIWTVTYSLKYRNNVLPAGLVDLQGDGIEPKFLITEVYIVEKELLTKVESWDVINGHRLKFGGKSYESVESFQKDFTALSKEALRINSIRYKDGLITK